MTLVNADTGEVISEDEYLESLGSRIRVEHRRSKEAIGEAVDAYFVIGQCLLEARQQLRTNEAFGAWLRACEFGFSRQWALVLRTAAEYEPAVRAALTTQVVNDHAPNIKKAVKQAQDALGSGRAERPPLKVIKTEETEPAQDPVLFSAIVVDPPWRYDNVATRGAAEDHYPTMSLADLAALEVPALPNAHLYLWVTNAFMDAGFDLLRAWGFTYKTCLTWCKPSIGMGNYFRNNTEHVLFAVRGSLPTNRNDLGTWFKANKTKHSAKPESFYDIVEASSPGPYLEMFARRRRFGWNVWGDEA